MLAHMSVEHAPPELQLAVDLIYLLECNEIAPETALAALEIVKRDYQQKLSHHRQE
ncbi:pleiotropic regulatory protein RsmS [Yersinia entomophaga]